MICLTTEQKAIIRREENEYPKIFAQYRETPYGILYYNEANKESYDSNHAVLYPEHIDDLSAVLRDITAFYEARAIVPSLYSPFVKDYFRDNEKTFIKCGYKITYEEDRHIFLLAGKSRIVPDGGLDIQKLTKWDTRILKDILLSNNQPYEAIVCEESMKRAGNHVFAGYKNEKAVVYVLFHVSSLGCTHFDYIVTAKNERGNGYARQIMHRVSEFCREENLPLPTAWFASSTSERLNVEAGFRPTDLWLEAGYAVRE